MSELPPQYDEDKKGAVYDTSVGPAHELPSGDATESGQAAHGLKRQMKNRHITMIAIGGVIGTGLFLGTGGALANGGPLGLFMGYSLMGSVCLATMVSLGEMISYLPIPGGPVALATRFVDPALGFTMGWNYWYNWTIILPAELSAAAVLINYWNKAVSNGVWITMCLVIVVIINFLGAGAYAECEFWFASIKVITIVGLIILGIIISAGGGPEGEKIGFKYWKDPGPLHQFADIPGTLGRFLGFFAVLTQAAFSYIGTEIVALAAAEAKNPRRNLPRAIKSVFIRILVFYLGGTFVIGIIVPSNDPSLRLSSGIAKSPWVIAIRNAGIPVLPSIINACLITSAWSAASSDLYTSSRALYALSITRQAPKIFSRCTARGLPWVSLIFCTLFASLAYMSLQSTAGTVFGYLANLTAAAGLLTWWGIAFTYVRFAKGLKAQGIDRKTLPYWSRLNTGSFAAYYSLTLISIILFFSSYNVFLKGAWDAPTFVTNYLPVFLYPCLFIAWKVFKKTKFIRPEDMDFYSGLEEIEAETYDEPPPRNVFEKIWSVMF